MSMILSLTASIVKMLEELKEEKENSFAVHLFSKNNQDNSDALKETKELLYQQFGKQALNVNNTPCWKRPLTLWFE